MPKAGTRSSSGRSTWRWTASKAVEKPFHLLPHLATAEEIVVRRAAHLHPTCGAAQHGRDLLSLRNRNQIVEFSMHYQNGNADAPRRFPRVVALAEHHLHGERREELDRDLGQGGPRGERDQSTHLL